MTGFWLCQIVMKKKSKKGKNDEKPLKQGISGLNSHSWAFKKRLFYALRHIFGPLESLVSCPPANKNQNFETFKVSAQYSKNKRIF